MGIPEKLGRQTSSRIYGSNHVRQGKYQAGILARLIRDNRQNEHNRRSPKSKAKRL
jgi:hypothetical protein